MNLIWLTKLIFSHLLTDFVLQPKKWVVNRNEKHFASPWLYVHTLITSISSLVFVGFNYWPYAIIIFITHTLIDGWKSYQPHTITYFLIDQTLHFLVIAACWFAAFFTWTDMENSWQAIRNNQSLWIIVTAYLFLSFPSGILIGQMTQKWSNQIRGSAGLVNAGKWIGILERFIILTFLLNNQYAAIGLLITAKGLLRFTEKDRQEEKTEYVLIGSLISISIAVFIGIMVKYFTGI